MTDPERKFVLLGATLRGVRTGVLPPNVWMCRGRAGLESAIAGASKRLTWLSFTQTSTDQLLERSVDAGAGLRGSRLIMLTPPRAESIPALLGLFHTVFGLGEGS